MKNILVTGGAGFIGSNFVKHILEKDIDIKLIILDALTYSGFQENLTSVEKDDRFSFIHGDICDIKLVDSIFSQNLIDTVVHFAAETHVDRSILDPGNFIQTNVIGTYTLLEIARKYWLGDSQGYRFHHISTDEVYGSLNPGDSPFSEDTPYDPNSPYSASKASSDHLARSYFTTYGLPITITNCSNNYGPNQYPEKLIPLMVLNAIQGKPLPVYGEGKNIRDWLYVTDHCEAIWEVLERGVVGDTYLIGGNNQPKNIEIVKNICDILDELFPSSPNVPHNELIEFVADRPGHDFRYDIDIRKIKNELGWEPKYSLQDGLMKTVRWYLDHPEWVEVIMRKEDFQSWIASNYKEREEK